MTWWTPAKEKHRVRESFANVNVFFAKNGRFNKQEYWTTTIWTCKLPRCTGRSLYPLVRTFCCLIGDRASSRRSRLTDSKETRNNNCMVIVMVHSALFDLPFPKPIRLLRWLYSKICVDLQIVEVAFLCLCGFVRRSCCRKDLGLAKFVEKYTKDGLKP